MRKMHEAPKLDVFADFAFADDGGVGLKQADQFITGRNALPLKHPALGLAHDLLQAGHQRHQLVGQALGWLCGPLSQSTTNLLGLLEQTLVHLQQGGIGHLHGRCCFVTAPRSGMDNVELQTFLGSTPMPWRNRVAGSQGNK